VALNRLDSRRIALLVTQRYFGAFFLLPSSDRPKAIIGYDFFYQWFQRVTTELLFKSYERYARKHREYRPLSREMFGREMVDKGFKPARLSEKESFGPSPN